MKKTDIGKPNTYNQGGQENKYQIVKTPFGELTVPCFVRVPKMSASKRTWAVWHQRFVERPKLLAIENQKIGIGKRLKSRTIPLIKTLER